MSPSNQLAIIPSNYTIFNAEMEASQKYRILSPLGRNQGRKFGSLFLVSNKTTDEKGVLKVVQKTNHSNTAEERLRAEAQFHFFFDGLPEILDIFESDQELIIIRKHVHGMPLDVRFNQIKKRERHVFICTVLKQLGILLNHIHKQGIYHCDIKPGNILVDEENEVHLIDFGLALRKEEVEDRKLLFPLGYAAPELLLNHLNIVDHRTDYFALGITLWRLYAGKIPLAHPNPSIFTNLQLTHPLPENHEVSTKIQKVLDKMCAKHSFQMPPNKMLEKDVERCLIEAKERRFKSFETFFSAFIEAGNKGLFTKRYLDGNLG